MLLAQITDSHIVAPGTRLHDRADPSAMLAAAVAHVNALVPRPDVVLATGDLVNDGRPAEYEELVRVLAELEPPLLAIPGNHDSRAALRAALPAATAFDTAPPAPNGSCDEADLPLDGVVESYPLRLIGLDTTIPGGHGGRFRPEQASWLDETLSAQPDRPTLIFQHHPPFATGIAWMDDNGLADRELEAAVVARHPQVVGVVCGHLHRTITTAFAGTVASTWPSTGPQIALALDGTAHRYADEPTAITLHHWSPTGGLVSHLSYVDRAEEWLPPWAVGR
ncbi:MAG: phosphodiesterase [Actinomycetota bacterium]